VRTLGRLSSSLYSAPWPEGLRALHRSSGQNQLSSRVYPGAEGQKEGLAMAQPQSRRGQAANTNCG